MITEQQVPLHPLAKKAAEAIVVRDVGAQSAIPPPAFQKLRSTLLAHRDDRVIFEHLAVLFVRLRDGGLDKAATQLLELARVGLAPDEVEKAAQNSEAMREAAKLLDEGGKLAVPGAMPAPKAPAGVGLRKTRKLF